MLCVHLAVCMSASDARAIQAVLLSVFSNFAAGAHLVWCPLCHNVSTDSVRHCCDPHDNNSCNHSVLSCKRLLFALHTLEQPGELCKQAGKKGFKSQDHSLGHHIPAS